MTPDQQENIRTYVVSDSGAREIAWRPFQADNPDKFAPDVAGVVISHASNGMDPAEKCVIRVVFGTETGEIFEMDKEVDPANAATDRPARPTAAPNAAPAGTVQTGGLLGLVQQMHLYAYNYETKEWVPLPWTASLQDQTAILLKEKP